jgi:hypothetical protein
MSEQIGILINASLHNELVLRRGKAVGVAGIIENVLSDFLERTKHDDMWCEEYLGRLEEEEDTEWLKKYGDPKKGYHWQNVFLPNATKLRFTYRGKIYYAEIRNQVVIYQDQPCSPSQFVRQVANHTSRNAWRDIWVQMPGKNEWQFAETMRRAN